MAEPRVCGVPCGSGYRPRMKSPDGPCHSVYSRTNIGSFNLSGSSGPSVHRSVGMAVNDSPSLPMMGRSSLLMSARSAYWPYWALLAFLMWGSRVWSSARALARVGVSVIVVYFGGFVVVAEVVEPVAASAPVAVDFGLEPVMAVGADRDGLHATRSRWLRSCRPMYSV